MIDLAGTRIHHHERGSGPPVFLLHGLGASSYSWRDALPALSKTRRVHAFDFPGFGRSDKPLDFDYSPDGFMRVLLGVMDSLGIDKADLVGNSMGGLIALWTALKFPDRVNRLVLIGTPTYPENRPKFLWPLRWPLLGPLLEAALGPWAVPFFARQALIDPKAITPELLEEYGAALRNPGGRKAVRSFVLNALPEDPEAWIARYKTLPHPTLIVWGTRDCMVDERGAQRLARDLPNAKLVRFPGLGHAPHEQNPGPVLDSIAAFLKGQ